MSTTILGTSSQVDDQDARVQTRGTREEDWVLPEIEPEQWNQGQIPTGGVDTRLSNKSSTTIPADGRKVWEPIRRDSGIIRFSGDRVKLLQQWECVILSLHDDVVECEMHDLTDELKPVEHAEVYLEEFNLFDRKLLREGAVFYWSVGHETKRTGQVRRYSELRVRRMPPLSNLKKREIRERAKRLSDLISNH
jgi:hypothetical protein